MNSYTLFFNRSNYFILGLGDRDMACLCLQSGRVDFGVIDFGVIFGPFSETSALKCQCRFVMRDDVSLSPLSE